MLCHLPDYARGFGGKYGVQKDRMDKVGMPPRGLLPSARVRDVCALGVAALFCGCSQGGAWLGFSEVQILTPGLCHHRGGEVGTTCAGPPVRQVLFLSHFSQSPPGRPSGEGLGCHCNPGTSAQGSTQEPLGPVAI